MQVSNERTLDFHLRQVLNGERRFENVFQAVSRMIEDGGYERVSVLGSDMFDFNIFRRRKKHLIGMHEEVNSFVHFVRDAAQGGSSKEMAYVLIGEPGNGKTFFVDYVCDAYRDFLAEPGNMRFSFKFKGLEELEGYSNISQIQSQTYEDPMILALNLFGSARSERERNFEFLRSKGFEDEKIEELLANYRPLAACSDFILEELRDHFDGDVDEVLKRIEIVPVPLSPTRGTVTGKYSAKDKTTSSTEDLLGSKDVSRMLTVRNPANPYRYDVKGGALARVGGGGIHFADELFKNKTDLIQVYLGVIQDREIIIDGFVWPLDTLIIATSNNDEFERFKGDGEQSPIIDRCRRVLMPHNTDVRLQRILTGYSLGNEDRRTVTGENLHIDPFLVDAVSDVVTLTRLPRSDKLDPIDMMKLASGEVAGSYGIGVLKEVIDELDRISDAKKRFGHSGLGQRALGRILQKTIETYQTQHGKCMTALGAFDAAEYIILNEAKDEKLRKKYLEDLSSAKEQYRTSVKEAVYNAYMGEIDAIDKDLMRYVGIVVSLANPDAEHGKDFAYIDPITRRPGSIRIDTKYVDSVEARMGLKSQERKDTFRRHIRDLYMQKIQLGKEYDFRDEQKLVEAVTDVRLNSDSSVAGSLVGVLSNRTNEENQQQYERMLGVMTNKLGFCPTCAEKTLEYYVAKDDES